MQNYASRVSCQNALTTITSIKKGLDDYDRLTDWIRPLARGLAIHSLTDS
jgi:hypothetical protein